MSNVIVLASAHTTDRKVWAGLRDTCELHGVQLKVLGTDKPLGYPSNDPRLFLESAPETLAFLRSTDAEYIVQTDATGKYVFVLTHNDAGTNRYIEATVGSVVTSSLVIAFDAV